MAGNNAVAFEYKRHHRSSVAGESKMIMHMRGGAPQPERADSNKQLHESPHGIVQSNEGTCLGATTTISEIAANDFVYENYRALAQAAALMATLQGRNSITVGTYISGWLNRGAQSRKGEPSDLATALLAFNAHIQLCAPVGERILLMDDVMTQGVDRDSRVPAIGQDEELVRIHIPRQLPGAHSLYLKALNSKVWAFAQVGVAVWLQMEKARVADARFVANGITPLPWRLRIAEQTLIGQALEETSITRAVESVLQEAMPLEQNAYKIPLVKGLLHRSLIYLAQEV